MMGTAKRMQELAWDQEEVAARIAIRQGWLERCEVCDEVFDPLAGEPEPEDVRAVAEEAVAAADVPGIELFRGDGQRLAEVLSGIQAEYGEECHCARVARSD